MARITISLKELAQYQMPYISGKGSCTLSFPNRKCKYRYLFKNSHIFMERVPIKYQKNHILVNRGRPTCNRSRSSKCKYFLKKTDNIRLLVGKSNRIHGSKSRNKREENIQTKSQEVQTEKSTKEPNRAVSCSKRPNLKKQKINRKGYSSFSQVAVQQMQNIEIHLQIQNELLQKLIADINSNKTTATEAGFEENSDRGATLTEPKDDQKPFSKKTFCCCS